MTSFATTRFDDVIDDVINDESRSWSCTARRRRVAEVLLVCFLFLIGKFGAITKSHSKDMSIVIIYD